MSSLPQASLSLLALLFTGIMAGFFFAYSFSAMSGLDRAQPAHAIDAMQGINVAVQNPAFFVFFFFTPLVCFAAAFLNWSSPGPAGLLLLGAGIVYLIGTFGVTVGVNVPMNNALAELPALTGEEAREAWDSYSGRWTLWNHVRTGAATLSLLMAGGALLVSGRFAG